MKNQEYKTTSWCDHCDKETEQIHFNAGHERDSSGDWQKCLECNWKLYGNRDEWTPPLDFDDDDFNFDDEKSSLLDKKLDNDVSEPIVSKESQEKHHEVKSGRPYFCFVCGTKLEEVGLGWLQCESEDCGEVFLPYLDADNNQCLMQKRTPFSPK